jgi:hypothetical protein
MARPTVRHVTKCDAVSHDEISHRAYEIYLERGADSGHELDDWLRAERELAKLALFKKNCNWLAALDRRQLPS